MPGQIQERIDALNKANADKKYIAVEVTDLIDLDTEENRIAFMGKLKKYGLNDVVEMHYEDLEDSKARHGYRRFAIIDVNQESEPFTLKQNDPADEVSFDDKVFTAVEMAAEFPGGMPALKTFLKENTKYPEQAKRMGVEGRVFIQFTVGKDGALSDFTFIKGISQEMDEEALRVLKLMPKWVPAKQNGKPVNSRFMMPVTFGLKESTSESTLEIREVTSSFQVEYSKKISGDKIIVSGTVTDSDNNPLPGANVIIVGGSTGTATDSNGNFKLTVPAQTKKLEVSFKGFNSTLLQL